MRTVCLLAATILAGCSSAPAGSTDGPVPQALKSDVPRETSPAVTPAQVAQAADDVSAFGWKLFRSVAPADGNLVVSPSSVASALAMTALGASGQAEIEMRAAMQTELSQSDFHGALDAVDLALADSATRLGGKDGSPGHLDVANAIFSDGGLAVSTPFLDDLARFYGAGVYPVDFATDAVGATDQINEWVASATRDHIAKLIAEPLSTDTRIALVNAMYLEASWDSPFEHERTHDAPFHAPGAELQVPTMVQRTGARHLAAHGARIVELAYRGNELAMDVVLPDQDLATFEAQLDPRQLAADLRALQRNDEVVVLTLPKFDLKPATSLDLAAPLRALGMRRAFEAGGLDRIAAEPLSIGAALHQATLKIDEDGVVAAAATVVANVGTSAPPPSPEFLMQVDRPFLVMVRHVATGHTLFVARIVDPTKR